MMSKDLISYIDNPSLLNEDTIIDLTLLSEQYPYFQTAQLLRIKNLHNISPNSIKPALNFTAAYVTDRKVLYYLLHPIKSAHDSNPVKTPEKVVKDTIGENIADTLKNQKNIIENGSVNDAIEFTSAMDVKKEYGDGVELDEYVVRITDDGPKLYELIEEEPQAELEETSQKEAEKQQINTNYDILTLINKGVPAEHLSGSSDNDLSENQIRSNSIIDNFIKANPKIKPESSEEKKITDFSKDSVKENDHLITDTLANIYVKQGNYAKAIFAYEKLSLKYPEKSAYFAGQIEEIKKLIDKT